MGLMTPELMLAAEELINQANRYRTVDTAKLADTLSKLTNRRYDPTNCGSCTNQRLKDLRAIYIKALEDQQTPMVETPQTNTDIVIDGTGSDTPQPQNDADAAGSAKRNRKRKA